MGRHIKKVAFACVKMRVGGGRILSGVALKWEYRISARIFTGEDIGNQLDFSFRGYQGILSRGGYLILAGVLIWEGG